MKVVWSILISVIFLLGIGNAEYLPKTSDKRLVELNQVNIPRIDKKVRALMKQYHTPGVAVALVGQHGIIWKNSFGVTKHHGKQKVNSRTLFSIESQTKMFTALGVMRAVQNGTVSLTTPIIDYLPNIKVYSVFQKKPANKITLANLLSHTAGFAHEAPVGNNYGSQASFKQHIKSIFSGVCLQFPVGKGYNYSNVGIDLAGYILQVKSHSPYVSYIKKNVLAPLKMYDSTFDIYSYLNNPNHAIGYIEGLNKTPINHSIIPAGGLYSNIDDMSHYIEFQLNKGSYQNRQILNKKLLDRMLTIPFPIKGQTQGNALGIWKGTRLKATYYSHLGRGFGFSDNLEWYPNYHIGIVVLTNKYDMNNIDIKIAHMIVDPIIESMFAKKKITLENSMLGEYVSNIANIKVVKNKSNNGVAIKGIINYGPTGNSFSQQYIPLTYIGNNEFFSSKNNQTYKFFHKGVTGVRTLQRISDGYMWFMEKPKNETKGPNKPLWKKYIGTYYLYGYVAPVPIKVYLSNGYLYLDNFKLIQKRSNIFIIPNGQVVVFMKNKLRWAGVNLFRKGKNGKS